MIEIFLSCASATILHELRTPWDLSTPSLFLGPQLLITFFNPCAHTILSSSNFRQHVKLSPAARGTKKGGWDGTQKNSIGLLNVTLLHLFATRHDDVDVLMRRLFYLRWSYFPLSTYVYLCYHCHKCCHPYRMVFERHVVPTTICRVFCDNLITCMTKTTV